VMSLSTKQRVLLSRLTNEHYRNAIRLYPYRRFHVNGVRKFLDKIYDIENDLNHDPQFRLAQGIARTLVEMKGEIRIIREKSGGERLYEKTGNV
jgi:hypothetical protein